MDHSRPHGKFAPFVCAAVLVLALAFPAHAEQPTPEMFLAPKQGARHVLVDGKGMERRLTGIENIGNKAVIEEEICCFQPASNESPPTFDLNGERTLPTPKEPWSAQDRYTLYVDGPKLMRSTSFGDITLVDLEKTEWINPFFGSPGMPKEGVCKVISKEWKLYEGKKRLVVAVELTASVDDEVVHRESWTLASGLGVIAMDDFKLSSIEEGNDQTE